MHTKRPELLAPASDMDSLQAAIDAGCDAVYFGAKKLNMRITANNFETSQLPKIIRLCHDRNVKAYLTINTIVFEDELGTMKDLVAQAKAAGIDAIIAWDLSVIKEVLAQGIELHVSTQASVSNSDAAEFYRRLGAKRVILARECTLDQIKDIVKSTSIEVECFVHGAMCVSVSGRCFLSHHLFNRSANRGDCLQPCRRSYIAFDPEEKHRILVGSNYLMSPKDLCALPILDRLIGAGISSFKIEGRRRSPEYVRTVVGAYRKALDLAWAGQLGKEDIGRLMEELSAVYNRGFSSGFYLGMPGGEDFTDEYGSCAKKQKSYVGYVRNFYQKISVIETKVESCEIRIGDDILIIGPTTGVHQQRIESMQIDHKDVAYARKGDSVAIKVSTVVRPRDKIFLFHDRKDRQGQEIKTGTDQKKPKCHDIT